MNAINFLDNMDGIVGGVSRAVRARLRGAARGVGPGRTNRCSRSGWAGATLGFLRYNFAPARIFLGDTGSLFLGYALGALGLIAAAHRARGSRACSRRLLVLGYPLFDTTFVVWTRLYEGPQGVRRRARPHDPPHDARRQGPAPHGDVRLRDDGRAGAVRRARSA